MSRRSGRPSVDRTNDVRDYLSRNPEATANEVVREVGGNRNNVLAIMRRIRDENIDPEDKAIRHYAYAYAQKNANLASHAFAAQNIKAARAALEESMRMLEMAEAIEMEDR